MQCYLFELFFALPDRRLSRKRSHVSLDRLRRSMSLETCRVDGPDGVPPDVIVERQTNSLKCRYNPPETIPEEEIERIRRESLIPRVGLLAGAVRRKSSMAAESITSGAFSAAMVTTTTSSVPPGSGPNSLASTMVAAARTATAFISGTSNSVVGADHIMNTSLDSQHQDTLERRDEGLGESFDRYSEISDTTSRTGIAASVIELQPLHSTCRGSPVQRLKTNVGVFAAPNNNKINGIKDAENDQFDSVTFRAPIFPVDSENDSHGIDPLAFLSEAQARQVTFM